jgi:hypothetical protein
MMQLLTLLTLLLIAQSMPVHATPIGYEIQVTTAYAAGNPFGNRIDKAYVEPTTGYFQIANIGETTFAGTVGTIAVSSFAGDLSFNSAPLVLRPGQSISVAIPNDAANVGGFNGPFYFYRPGVEITLNGTISDSLLSETVSLLVADRDIHSGVPRTDEYGLTSDSFVLQGGDPWGFQTAKAFALSQSNGAYIFAESVPEPASLSVLAIGMTAAATLSGFRRSHRKRQ